MKIVKMLIVLALYLLTQKPIKCDITGGSFVKSRFLNESVIQVYEKVGPKMCIKQCMYHTNCKAINFWRSHLKCSLLRVNIFEGDIENHLSVESGVDFTLIANWTTKEDSCWSVNPCKTEQQCVLSLSNQPVCIKSTTPCSSRPCLHGKCDIISGSSYTCTCNEGCSGSNCEITPCTSGPCVNSGTCYISGSSYNCTCKTGYSGPNCEFTPCSSRPCVNNGACSISGSSYNCACNPCYSGPNCEFTPCTSRPCVNSGTCYISGSSYTCTCNPGYSGPNCELLLINQIQSTNYPSSYVSGEEWSITLTATSVYRILVRFTEFVTESVHDTLTAYDGPASSYRLIISMSGNWSISGTSSADIESTGMYMYLKWKTDSTVVYKGWHANVYWKL